ncbi:MAG: hypothetical protein M8866_02795 [marine benthic group bacterium]|nr:hypothetical protein [Candidatus Benthicola marisminoris]
MHRGLGLLAFLILGPGAFGGTLQAQTGGWRTDDRVLITDFGIVTAMARSSGSVFVATTGGLVELDEAFRGSALPVTVEDGYPLLPPTAMAYDRRDRSVWLAAGVELYRYDPLSRRFRDRLGVGRAVSAIVPAEGFGSELFLRIGAEWWSFDTFSRDLRRAERSDVLSAIDARADLRTRWEALGDPFFRDGAEQAVRTMFGRPVRILDFVPSRTAYMWWLGTAGSFVVEYDGVGRVGGRGSFGPAGLGMAAVEATEEEVWLAPEEPLEGRYGIAAATRDLQAWRSWRADSSSTVPELTRALHRTPSGTWAGGASGLHWLGEERPDWRQERSIDLSYQPVLALAQASGPTADAVWVGTIRGVLRVQAPGAGIDLAALPSVPVGSVVEADGAVWLGTERGLFAMLVPDSVGQPVEAGRVNGPVALRSPVGALAAEADTIYVGVEREVWWKPGRESDWVRMESIGRAQGLISALEIREGVLWVGSTGELTVVEVSRGVVGRYSFGRDLPPDARGRSGVLDIAVVSDTEAWVATPAGAVRLTVRH